MAPFPAHDLLADFRELRRRLLLVLDDGSAPSKATLIDALLLACGLNQILEDYISAGGSSLTLAARVVSTGAPVPLRHLARPLCAGAEMIQGRRDGRLRARQRELAAVVDGLADDVARMVRSSEAPEFASRPASARFIETLGHLGRPVQEGVIRPPACFRRFDQDPEDFARLVDRFSVTHSDRDRPVLVVGLRTSGSYTAPLCAAFLRRQGYRRVETITIRPRKSWLPGDVNRVRAAAGADANVLLSDDPPNTGGSLIAIGQDLEAFGIHPSRIVIAVALMTEELPEGLARYERVTLDFKDWAIQDRLSETNVCACLDELLTNANVRVDGQSDVKVKRVRQVTRIEAGSTRDSLSILPTRRHVQALYHAQVTDEAGREHELQVYVKGTGLGYFGEHSAAVAGPLQHFFPAVHGVRDGLMFRAWMPNDWSLGDRSSPEPADLTRRIASYVLARRNALGTTVDMAGRLIGEAPIWRQTSKLMRGLFGNLWVLALAPIEGATRRLLHVERPSVVDGSMDQSRWFAEPGAGSSGIRKVDFDEHDLTHQDYSVDQFCYDAIYDLASAAADHDAGAAQQGEDGEFVDSLKREYELASGSQISEERWFLYQLIHTAPHQWFMADLPGPHMASDRMRMVLNSIARERAMSRAAQRYYRAHFFGHQNAPAHGPLCAIDVDGVLETDHMGFPATSPAGAVALRALIAHGYRPVLATGRSLDELRERCDSYGLPGGVAEYGAVVYVADGDRTVRMASLDADKRLRRLRDLLVGDPSIHIDIGYRDVVRAYAFDRLGRRTHLDADTVRSLASKLTRSRLRLVNGALQTDFVPEEVDKGAALSRLQVELGGALAAPLALAVGDTASDITLFELAGRSRAPANADDAVRAASRTMTNLEVMRGRAQVGLYTAVRSMLGHPPGGCAICEPPHPDADGKLLLTMLSAQDGRKLHKLRTAVSLAIQLIDPILPKAAAAKDHRFIASCRAAARRFVKGEGLVGSSGLLLAGNMIARAVGLLFVVAAARFLTPANYGLLAYALVIVGFGTVLVTNVPAGLSGFLARSATNRAEQDKCFSNWLVVVTAALLISVAAIAPIALAAGLKGWMIPALMANIVGIAVFETYRASQRGLANFRAATGFYVVANVVQLVAILVVGLTGFRDPALFVTIYGLTNLVALLIMEIAMPTPLRFRLRAVRPHILRRIALISWPLLLQTAFFAIWIGCDLILVRTFLAAPLAGDYAATKTLVNLVALPAGAIGSAVLPRIAGLSGPPFRRDVLRALGLTAAGVAPMLLFLMVLGGSLLHLAFGSKYPHSAEALPLLAVGMAAYAFYVILESVWIGLGRPAIDAVATGAGLLATVAIGLVLVPRSGLVGAAAAFAIGAGIQVTAIGLFTVFAYRRALREDRPLGQPPSLETVTVMPIGGE